MKNRSPGFDAFLRTSALVALASLGSASESTAREWTPVFSPTANDLTSVHFSDSQHGFAAGAFGTLLKTSDGGRSWTTVATPVNFSFVSVWTRAPEDAMIGRVGLYRTMDCGKTWDSDVGGFEQFGSSIFDILFTAPDSGFFIKGGNVFRSTDGGTVWNQVGGSGQFLDDLHYAGGQTIYSTGGITFIDITGSVSRGELERSRDGGATWSPVLLPGINDIYAAVWESENSGYVFTFTNMAHHTGDGGDSWTLVSGSMSDVAGEPLPTLIIDALIDEDSRIFAVDFNGNFLESEDGAVWTIQPGSGDPLSALTRLPDGTLIAVGNGGQIWRSPPSGPSEQPVIIGIELGNDGEGETVTIHARGTPGFDYRLVSSPDISSWLHETSATAIGETFSFVLERQLGREKWFYRVEETGGR